MTRIFFAVLFVCPMLALTQDQYGYYKSELPKVIGPSPNGAALAKYGLFPVNHSTGIPEINHPLFDWKLRNLSLSVSLSYHAGGHKVEDLPGDVGLGWVLQGAGRVSRTVKGLPDDDKLKGFMYTPALPLVNTGQYTGEYVYSSMFPEHWQAESPSEVITPNNSPYSSTILQINNGELDGEQDVFSYSIGRISGRFVISKQLKVIHHQHTNHRVEYTAQSLKQNNNQAGNIKSFIITDDLGIKYFFEEPEYQGATQITFGSQNLSTSLAPSYVSGWLITKIQDPRTGDEIQFTYQSLYNTKQPPKYEAGFSQSQTFDLERLNPLSNVVAPAYAVGQDMISYNEITLRAPKLSTITLPDGSKVSLVYDFSRLDLKGDKALTSVEVRNNQNVLVKKYGLRYSYFTTAEETPPSWVGSYTSGNDYSLRLRLDAIDEVAVDNSQVLTTSFTYDGTPLNRRDSRNVDFWGYNVNPSRNNVHYVPRVVLQDLEYVIKPEYGIYLSGANREPDANFSKAALLSRVDYPTGGYTVFQFEPNSAYDEVDYFEDVMTAGDLIWGSTEFGVARGITFNDRREVPVEFQFEIQELQARPSSGSGVISCLEGIQDANLVVFEIFSTDGSFQKSIQGNYASFIGGKKAILELPLGKSYQVRFSYPYSGPCDYVYPFRARCSAIYRTAPREKLVGGMRLKMITSFDGLGKSLSKEFSYQRPDGRVSARLNIIPNFGYYRTTVDVAKAGNSAMWTRQLKRTSSPMQTLDYFAGAPLIYTRVTELEANGGKTVREFDPIYSIVEPPRFPYRPIQDFPFLSGLLTRESVYDDQDALKQEKVFAYNKILTSNMNEANRNLKTGTVATGQNYNAAYMVVSQYDMVSGRAEMISDTLRVFEYGSVLQKIGTRTFDPFRYYLRTEAKVNSRGEVTRSRYTYPFETTGTVYQNMTQANQLAIRVTSVDSNLTLAKEVSRVNRAFGFFNNGLNVAPSSIEDSWNGNLPQQAIKMTKYDAKGNLVEYVTREGIVTSLIWGYNQSLQVATVVGAGYDQAMAVLNAGVLNSPGSDATLRSELVKLRTLPGKVLVESFTYKPLVGVSSKTNANGLTEYYEYDGMNRLKRVLDHQLNVIKVLDYQYKKSSND